jgi:hypothetical protein
MPGTKTGAECCSPAALSPPVRSAPCGDDVVSSTAATAIQMLDVHFPTTDGRTLILSRYTELNPDQKLLVRQLNLELPPQSPPRITAAGQAIRPHALVV